MGFHKLFYEHTGLGAFAYRIACYRPGDRWAGRYVARGDVTGLRGKSDAIRAHLTQIGREAIGERGEPVLRVPHGDVTREMIARATPAELLAGVQHVWSPRSRR